MIFEIEADEAGAKFAELMQTLAAGYGVLIRRGEVVVARLVPEAAFQADAAPVAEHPDAREVLEAFQAQIEDEF